MFRYVHKRAKSASRREAAVTIGSHNVSVMRSFIYIRGVDYIPVTEKGVETSVNVSPRLCVCVCVKSQDMVNHHRFHNVIIRPVGSSKPFYRVKTAHTFPLMQKRRLITLFCFDAVSVCFLQ